MRMALLSMLVLAAAWALAYFRTRLAVWTLAAAAAMVGDMAPPAARALRTGLGKATCFMTRLSPGRPRSA